MRKISSVLVFGIFFLFFNLSFCSASHFIVGVVNDAYDGEDSNGHVVVIWNSVNGMNDNLTDVVGPGGNSGADSIYMFDCEMLSSPCVIGETLKLKVFDFGSGYVSDEVEVVVTGAGYDIVSNMTLNSNPRVISFFVDDDILSPQGEIDLLAGGSNFVTCQGIIEDLDGDFLVDVSAKLFSFGSFLDDIDDNNFHYSNDSCFVDSGYGENQSLVVCGFSVEYYAESGDWECDLSLSDGFVNQSFVNSSYVNELLSLEILSEVDFGWVSSNSVSNETVINVSNFGNVMVNLSISGYAENPGDDYAMSCTSGGIQNIPIWYQKYNFTSSNAGEIDYDTFNVFYENLTSSSVIRRFDLNFRQNDFSNDAIGFTYWRVFLPEGAAGSCSGNIVFSAVRSSQD